MASGQQIGSTVGTVAGTAFGPVGSVVGGVLGGAVGGMFGGGGGGSPYLGGVFPKADTRDLAAMYGSYLENLLRTPVQQSPQFLLGRESIMDATTMAGGAARQRLGDRSSAMGFLDSGSVNSGLNEIDRAEIQAFGAAIRDLVLGLEDRKSSSVLPYLAAASGSAAQFNQSAIQSQGQDQDFFMSLIGAGLQAESQGIFG